MRLKQRLSEIESLGHHTTSQPTVQRSDISSEITSGVGDETSAVLNRTSNTPTHSSHDLYGSSPTGFTNQIHRILEHQPLTTTQKSKLPQNTQPYTVHGSFKQYIAPDRCRADQLLAIYWRLVDTLYPVLRKKDLEAKYKRIWTGEDLGHDGYTLICIFNIMFATAALLDASTKPEDRTQEASGFYERIRSLLDFELLGHQSFLQVQLLLLLGHYLLSTDDPQQAWNLSNLACRAARDLSLGSTSPTEEALSEDQEQARRKLWHGCVLLDRMVAVTLDRPATITAQTAKMLPRPLINIAGGSQGGKADDTVGHFFVQVLELYDILDASPVMFNATAEQQNGIVQDTCALFFGSSGSKAISSVLGVDQRMLLWSRRLPVHLRYDSARVKTQVECRQLNVLYLTYRNIRTLLLRPILSRFCSVRTIHRSTLQDTLPWKLAHQFCVSCVQSALETVEFYDRIMDAEKDMSTFDDLLPAWWCSVFYIYTAATVLVCARLHPAIFSDLTAATIEGGWSRSSNLLKRFECFGPQARTCRTNITTMFEQAAQQCQQRERLALEKQQHHNTLIKQYLTKLNQDRQRQESTEETHTSSQRRRPQPTVEPGAETFNHLAANFEYDNTPGQWLLEDSPWRVDDMMGPPMTGSSANLTFDASDVTLDLGDMSWLMSQEMAPIFT